MAAGDKINGLITNGLGVGLPACAMMMTATTFTLGPVVITLGGGSRPMPPGTAKDFYKPVDRINLQDPPFYTPYNVPVKKCIVKVNLKFGDREIEKEYAIREQRLKVLVKVLNFTKRVQGGISVMVVNMKKIATRASVRILRFRKRN